MAEGMPNSLHTSPIPETKDSAKNLKIESSPGTESAKDSGKCSASDTSNNAKDRSNMLGFF